MDEENKEMTAAPQTTSEASADTSAQPIEAVKLDAAPVDATTTPSDGIELSDVSEPPQGNNVNDVSEPHQEENVIFEKPPSAPQSNDQCQQMKMLVESAVQQLLSAFNGLQESFDGKLRYDAKKDTIIDRQYQELSQFKTGLVEKVTMQIVGDLIGEIDSAQKLVRFYENAECNETNFKKMQKVLRDIPASLCDVLEKYGVTSYSSKVGDTFNPKRHRALKTTETGDETKDKTIRELLRLGFEQELEAKDDQPPKMKVLRSEMVDVFVFNPALAEASSDEKQQEPSKEAEEQSEAPTPESK